MMILLAFGAKPLKLKPVMAQHRANSEGDHAIAVLEREIGAALTSRAKDPHLHFMIFGKDV
jgi:hypothetical protein